MSKDHPHSLRLPLQWFVGSLVIGTALVSLVMTDANDGFDGVIAVISLATAVIIAVTVFMVVAALEFRASRRSASPIREEARDEGAWRVAAPELRLESPSHSFSIPRRARTLSERLWLALEAFMTVVALGWFFGDSLPLVGDRPGLLSVTVGTAALVLAVWTYRRLERPEPDVKIIFDDRAVFWPEDREFRRIPLQDFEQVYWVRGGRSPQVVARATGLAIPLPERCVVDERHAQELVGSLLEKIDKRIAPSVVDLPYRPSRLLFGLLSSFIVTAFAAQVLLGGDTHPIALLVLGANAPALVEAGEVWRLVTGSLLHLGPVHLIVNLLALYIIGRRSTSVMGLSGGLCVFGVSALAGAWVSAAVGGHMFSVGASGGILGLLGAETAAHWRGYGRYAYGTAPWIHFSAQCGWVILLSLFPGIDFLAHLGGFFAGALIGLLVSDSGEGTKTRGRETRRRVMLAVAIICTLPYAVAAGWMAKKALGEEIDIADPRWLALEIPALNNNLAWYHAWERGTTPGRLEQLRAHMVAMLEEERAPHWLDTLAAVELRAGEFGMAVSLEREASAAANLAEYRDRLFAYETVLESSAAGPPPSFRSAELRQTGGSLELLFREEPMPSEVESRTWLAFLEETSLTIQPVSVVHCRLGTLGSRSSIMPVTFTAAPGGLVIPDDGVRLRLEPQLRQPPQPSIFGEGTCGIWALPSSAGIAEVDKSSL